MGGGFNPISAITGGGGLGGIMNMVGGLAQTLAPLANFILPGIGPMIAQFGGQALQGVGNMVSKMEEEAQDQTQMDKREALNFQAAQDDKRMAMAA